MVTQVKFVDWPTRLGKPLEWLIITLIVRYIDHARIRYVGKSQSCMVTQVLNVLVFILGTVESINPPDSAYRRFTVAFEVASVMVFTLEYLLRLYCIGRL
eukprot:COSAG05_NODE_500_length_9234_cov_107.281664_9_plen_100_part_00